MPSISAAFERLPFASRSAFMIRSFSNCATDFLKNELSLLATSPSTSPSSPSPASWSPNGSSRLVMIWPRERTTARSITFSSSRTLPGQLYSISRRMASSLIAAGCAVALLREEVLDERRDVLLAIAERRHVDVDHVEPVVEVVAELRLLDLLLQILVRRDDDPDVHLDRQVRADA